MARRRALILPRAILFDMDGTLTVPHMDFARIKAEMGLRSTEPILETLARMSEPERQRAEDILHRHEDDAAAAAALNPGCLELLAWLQARQIATALITRNRRVSVESLVQRYKLPIEVRITREDGRFKPDPAPLLLACQRLGVSATRTWMVGDGQHDIVAGTAAGMATVWVSHGRDRDFEPPPACTVRDLLELADGLKRL